MQYAVHVSSLSISIGHFAPDEPFNRQSDVNRHLLIPVFLSSPLHDALSPHQNHRISLSYRMPSSVSVKWQTDWSFNSKMSLVMDTTYLHACTYMPYQLFSSSNSPGWPAGTTTALCVKKLHMHRLYDGLTRSELCEMRVQHRPI